MTDIPLEHVHREPELDADGAVFILHGRGADEQDLFPVAEQLPGKRHVVSFRAPDRLRGGYTWYDLDLSAGGLESSQPDPEGFRRSLDLVAESIDAAVNASAEVRVVRFTLSEERRTELREQAIENAMTDARSQADTVAENGDLQVTGVNSVDASQQRYRPVEYDAAAPRAAEAGGTSVETGDVSVSYQVRVTYDATRA